MKCTKCGNEYDGKFCPECGTPAEPKETSCSTPAPAPAPKKKGGCLKIFVIALLLILALLVFSIAMGGSSDSPANDSSDADAQNSTAATPEPEYIEVTAKDLLAAYDENTVSADNTYKDQLLKVTGTVGTIGKDIMDDAYVTLTSDEPYSLISVQCYFSKDNLDAIASLKEGDTVTITGKCDGESLNVLLKQCNLVVE